MKRGINGYQLKLLGAALMVLDHIHEMFYWAGDLTWMNMLGRSVMPIFLFMCAEGFYYTKSRKKYAARLLLGAVLMPLASTLISEALPIEAHPVFLMNNVFATMFLAVVVMYGIERIKSRDFLRGIAAILLPALPVLLLPAAMQSDNLLFTRIVVLIPSYMSAEGGILMILLAVWFYWFREKRMWQYLGITALAAFSAFSYPGFRWESLFGADNNQWMMLFSIIPLHFYNGQRGRGSKYFFYIFYPAHIYALYLLAFVLLKSGVLH